jgi:glycosyltransferase involved in cell wall biosynthesis
MTSITIPVSTAPDISVVVPCYNAAPWLESLLESLTAQRGANWELIFVDDGSTDHTARVLSEICAREPRARAIHIPN